MDNIKQNAAIFISNTILQSKEPGILGEMADSRARTGNIPQTMKGVGPRDKGVI